MTWNVQCSHDGNNWVEADALEYRNAVGAPVDSVTRQASPWVSIHPGVLRYYVKAGTFSAGVSATLLTKVVNDDDLLHPLIDETTGKSVSLAIGNANTNLITGVTVQLNPNMQEDDEFELAPGYTFDTTLGDWISVQVLGIVTPGYTGKSTYLKFTNNYSRDLVECIVAVSASVSSDYFEGIEARQSDGNWQDPGTSPFYISAEGEITGHVPAGDSATVEVRAAPGSTYDATDNPITIGVKVAGREI